MKSSDAILIKYNLQFFAEGNNGDTDTDVSDDTSTDNSGDNSDASSVDVQALADLISDKDKQIKELQVEMSKLKKTNADLLVKVTAGDKPPVELEQTILDFCDIRKIK